MTRGYGVMPESFTITDRSLARRLLAFAVPAGQTKRVHDLRRGDEALYDVIITLSQFGSVDGPTSRTETDIAPVLKKDELTVREAAQALDYEPNSVRRLIRTGLLTTTRSNPYMIPTHAVIDYRNARN